MTTLGGARVSGRGVDRLALAGLLVVVGAAFSAALLTSRVFFERDISGYWVPHVEVFVRTVAEGSWPLWNPFTAFGAPLLAEPSLQIAYPPTWLNLILLPATYYKLFVVLHCWGAGCGLYLLARRWGLSPIGAFVAGVAWSVSGPLVSTVNLFHHFAGAAWMPWVLLALERVLQEPGLRAALFLGAAQGAQVLAGSGDLCVLTVIAEILRCGALLVGRDRPSPRQLRALLGLGVVSATFALGLSAVQWMPTLAVARSGIRFRQGPQALYWSVHPLSLADLIVPRLVADLPMSDALRARVFESRAPLLRCLYLGLPAGVLVAMGIAAGGGNRFTTLAAASFLLFLACALGPHTPVFPLLLNLPPIRMFRFPSKYMLAASLFWAFLAGRGIEAWRHPAPSQSARQRAALVAAVAVVLGGGCLLVAETVRGAPRLIQLSLMAPGPSESPASLLAPAVLKLQIAGVLAFATAAVIGLRRLRPYAPAWLTACLVALVAGDLVGVARRVNELGPPEILTQRAALASKLGPFAEVERLYVSQAPVEWMNRHFVRGPAGWKREWAWALGLQEMLWPPLGARWGLHGSYDGDFTGLASIAHSVLSFAASKTTGTRLGLRLLQMGNVGHVVSVDRDSIGGLQEVDALPSIFDRPVRLFRVPDPLPRTYAVDGVRPAEPPQAFLGVLADPGLDLRREIVLPGVTPRASDPGFEGSARIVWHRANAVGIDAELRAPGFVVLVESFSPDWTATVDGRPTEVLPANQLFRAVAVPAGKHRVELAYRPRTVLWGAALTTVALFGWVGLLRRRSPARGQPQPHGHR